MKSLNYVLKFKCSQNICQKGNLPMNWMLWNLSSQSCYCCLFIWSFLSGPALESEIFCLKAVIVACSYGVSNSRPAHTYKQREQATITALRQNISLSSSGPEMSMEYWKTFWMLWKILKNLECWEYWETLFWMLWKTEHYEKLKICYENFFNTNSLLNTAWRYVTVWIIVFCEMYNTLMKHYEDGKSFF